VDVQEVRKLDNYLKKVFGNDFPKGEDPETEMIIGYIEGLKDGRRFFNVCKEVSRKKPIILWKGGMTEGGARAAVSHTGAMAGSGAAWAGVMRQAGIVSVRSK